MNHQNKMTVEEAVSRLSLREVVRELGISIEIPEQDKREFECIFCGKKKLNFFDDGTRFNCYSCESSGRAPDLITKALNITPKDGLKLFLEMVNGDRSSGYQSSYDPAEHRAKKEGRRLQEEQENADKRAESFKVIVEGSIQGLSEISKQRNVSYFCLRLLHDRGIVRFAVHHGNRCWVLTDEARRVAEARRLDGDYFWDKIKGLTLEGSVKRDWLVGINPKGVNMDAITRILVVEGMPDLLAAQHFIVAEGMQAQFLPVAILGKSSCRTIHPKALEAVRGKHVRFFPHYDCEDQADNLKPVKVWAEQLINAGCAGVSAFNFKGFKKWRTGEPVNDLNDMTYIDPIERASLNILGL